MPAGPDPDAGIDRRGLVLAALVYAAIVLGLLAPTMPADHGLVGIPLPAGEHEFTVYFRPRSLDAGIAISGSAWCLFLVAAAATRRRRSGKRVANPRSPNY
jgi:hypothetical protein